MAGRLFVRSCIGTGTVGIVGASNLRPNTLNEISVSSADIDDYARAIDANSLSLALSPSLGISGLWILA